MCDGRDDHDHDHSDDTGDDAARDLTTPPGGTGHRPFGQRRSHEPEAAGDDGS